MAAKRKPKPVLPPQCDIGGLPIPVRLGKLDEKDGEFDTTTEEIIIDEGLPQERVYDVAWSDGRELAADGTLPAVGNTVNISTGAYTNSIGAAQLAAAWTDQDFDPAQRAFYYVRVLQIPTPRHTLLDAIALGIDPAATGRLATLQERAYTSPVWYAP